MEDKGISANGEKSKMDWYGPLILMLKLIKSVRDGWFRNSRIFIYVSSTENVNNVLIFSEGYMWFAFSFMCHTHIISFTTPILTEHPEKLHINALYQ